MIESHKSPIDLPKSPVGRLHSLIELEIADRRSLIDDRASSIADRPIPIADRPTKIADRNPLTFNSFLFSAQKKTFLELFFNRMMIPGLCYGIIVNN